MLVLNPAWPHFVGVFAVGFACFLGIFRLLFNGWDKPMHCKALLNEGRWLDSQYQNWQPDSCILHRYTEPEVSSCLQSKEIIFAGDSVTRKLFFEFAKSLDHSLPKPALNRAKKHSDHKVLTKYGTRLKFVWDPFLNKTYTKGVLGGNRERPAMLVLGSGLWYLRYANTSGGVSAWESNMDDIFNTLVAKPKPADEVIFLPVEQLVTTKLSQERASTMHPSDIEAMNSDLYHRINPPVLDSSSASIKVPVSLPLVFNQMLDESMTEDGLHFSDDVLKIQARILINLRCNDAMPKVHPFNKTCCNRYPMPSVPHMIMLALVFLSGPFVAFRVYTSGFTNLQTTFVNPTTRAPLIISGSLLLIYLADRSDLWLKEQRQFDPWVFGGLCMLSIGIGFATAVRTDTDLGFLNRDQTDEWKGWMQILILIYHYCYGSQISGIYNPMRVLVASYLFMTGYGHTTFYLRKADYGLSRIVQVLLRLNLFTVLLAYTMNTDYMFYYFTPLVTVWYFVVYFTLLPVARLNNRAPILLAKVLLSAGMVTWFFRENWPLERLFQWLYRFCGIHWSAREWSFRVNLDIWIVYVGMLVAIASIKIRENRLTDDSRWPSMLKGAVVVSGIVLVWFFVFELYQESKITYNTWHPYISFLPIVAFVILRNANSVLRSASSRAFAFVGRCSLELFIIQFHFWLAADSKGILVVLPGTNLRPINFVITSVMFVYICDRISWATGDIVTRTCGGGGKEHQRSVLPIHSAPSNTVSSTEEGGQEILIHMKDLTSDSTALEPNTPIRPRRWMNHSLSIAWRLQHFWTVGPLKIAFLLFIFWLFNIFWVYPPRSR